MTESRQPHPPPAASAPGVRIDRPRLAEFLGRLRYPLHLLDFETVCLNDAAFLSLASGAHLPFQYSLHTVASPGAVPVPFAYLARPGIDPRPELLAGLRNAIGPVGSLVAYNAGFEKARLRECAEALPEHRAWVESLLPRFVDLLQPFRRRVLYHPRQENSASLKRVLPAWTGRDYAHLQIQDGRAASETFLALMRPGCPRRRAEALVGALLRYCEQDTLALYWLIEAMTRLAAARDD